MVRALIRMAATALAMSMIPSALAETRSVYISPATMGVQPVYRSDILNPVLLTDKGDSSIRVGFMLPPDYSPNTKVTLRIHMQSATSCSIVFGVLYFDRSRPGQDIYETSPPNVDGMTKANMAVVSLPAQKLTAKTFEITAPLKAPFTGQKPGDGFLAWFERSKTNPLDTCGIITIWHAEARYTSAP